MQALLESKGIQHALSVVGNEHKYQIRTALIIAWQYLFRSFFLIYYAFLTQPPVFLCEDPLNPGSFYDCGENNGGCVRGELSPNSPSSLVIDLGFYCERNYLRTLGGSFFFVGGNIGVALTSYLSDQKGRKFAISWSYLFGSIAFFLLGTAASGPFTYVFFLMLIWGNMSNYTVLTLTYVAEFSSEKFARDATALLLVSIVIGELIVVGVAYFIHSWQVIMVGFIAIPALLTNLTFRGLEETPVYLFSKKEIAKAAEVLEKVAEYNEKPLVTSNLAIDAGVPRRASVARSDEAARPVKTWNYLQIIVHPKLTVRVLTFSLIKLYLCMAYFGCIFALSSLGGSIYTNSAIAAIAEGLGYSLSLKAYLFPTRKLLKASLLVVVATGISFLLIPALSCESFFICQPLFIQGALSLIMRTAICFMYGFIYSLGNELFPPEVRSQSNGISGIFSDIGGIIAPIVLLFAETNQLNPLFLFGVIGFLALGAGQYLPEDTLVTLDDEKTSNIDIELNYVKMAD